MPSYSREQLLELYNNLPPALQDAIYSEQNAKNIEEICEKNNITDKNTVFDISSNVGYVLLGLLPPSELAFTLEKELKLNKAVAYEVSNEISRFIFFPLRQLLEPLYGAPVSFKEKSAPPPEENPEINPETQEQSNQNYLYREPIE